MYSRDSRQAEDQKLAFKSLNGIVTCLHDAVVFVLARFLFGCAKM